MTRLIPPIVILVAIAAWMSVFTVDERELAVKLRFGDIVVSEFEPGLHFKMPIADRVLKFENRILTLDHRPERFLTSEKKNVLVDFFVKWQIHDAGAFYRATTGNMSQARERLLEIARAGLRNEFARRTVKEVVAAERAEMMELMVERGREATDEFGVSIVDFRIKQVELPDGVTQSVFERMRKERQRAAALLRAEGAEAAERIRADADRQREVILAEAYSKAEEIRGAGDARAAEIYASAYEQDEEFFSFYRSMLAYQRTFEEGGQNILLLDPESDFFRYFDAQILEE